MATPDLHEEQLTGEDEAVIMATDGLWDVISNQEAVDFIKDIKVGRLHAAPWSLLLSVGRPCGHGYSRQASGRKAGCV